MKLSIVIPVLNESATLVACLSQLQDLRCRGCELVLVDGGSTDGSQALAEPLVDLLLTSEPGRARQMMSGANLCSGDTLLFLHADTCLPDDADSLIQQALTDSNWGRFDVCLSGGHRAFLMIAWFMNHRSRLTGIATGDQAMFVRRLLFDQVGGFIDQPLMEDIELSKQLKKDSPPACVSTPIVTSSRRWEERGIMGTILLMWKLRLLYFFGVSAEKLAKLYRR